MKKLFITAVLVMLVTLTGYTKDTPQSRINNMVKEAKSSIDHISPADLLQKIKTETNFVLIDIRELDEWQAGHISSAIHIGRGVLEFGVCSHIKDPDTEVILYCQVGVRSALATKTVQALGYTNVKDLEGGIKAWAGADYPFYNDQGEIKIIVPGKKDPKGSK